MSTRKAALLNSVARGQPARRRPPHKLIFERMGRMPVVDTGPRDAPLRPGVFLLRMFQALLLAGLVFIVPYLLGRH